MFGYSIYDAPGGVAYILCSTTRCCAYNKVYNIFGFVVKELLNLFYSIISGLPNSFKLFSNFPINRFAYAGAIFVPIAVPWICR